MSAEEPSTTTTTTTTTTSTAEPVAKAAEESEVVDEKNKEHEGKHSSDSGAAAATTKKGDDDDDDDDDKKEDKKDDKKKSEAKEKPKKEEKLNGTTEVIVHVYDLSEPANDKLFRVGLGFYHSGIELKQLNVEYWFQGHDQRYTGILEIDHRTALRAIPQVRESVSLGMTKKSVDEIHQIVDRLTLEYRGCTYNVLRHNCNAFCLDLVKALEPEKKFPSYINRMANMGSGLMRVVPDSLVWWSMGKFGVSKSDVEIQPRPEEQEPCIGRDGTVMTLEQLREVEGVEPKGSDAKQQAKDQGDETGRASYQSLSGASEGVALLDRRGVDDSEAEVAAAHYIRSAFDAHGPVHLMSATQQRYVSQRKQTRSLKCFRSLFVCVYFCVKTGDIQGFCLR